jgi:Chlorophyll A-B binding protein
MLAVAGHIATTAGLRLPGNEDFPTGLKALTAIPAQTLLTNIAIAGAFELLILKDAKGTGEYPGDFRNGLFKWSASPEEQLEKRAIELNNGRAAQMGILGLMFHEQMTGEPYVLNAFLGYPTV